jgi:hypothetical protein
MAFSRHRPPFVRQSNIEHCWAAAIDSLSQVEARLGGRVHQNELVHASWIQSQLNANHGLNMLEGFRTVTTHFRMHYQGLTAGVANPATFEAALRRSYVYVGYVVTVGVASHIVVAYGITNSALKIMDPYRGFLDVPMTTVNNSPLRLGFYFP